MARSCVLVILLLLGVVMYSHGQQTHEVPKKQGWFGRLKDSNSGKGLIGVLTRTPESEPPVFNVKSEDPYLPYAGKIIRKIIVRRIGFESTVLDTSRHMQTFISNAANAIHIDTKEFVVRNNLFIKEGKPLNPFRVADNERTLRNLGFVLDCRILVKPISKHSDSVDLIVVTRDVFSLGVAFSPEIPTRYKLIVTELNAGGMGQSIQVGSLYDINRSPNYGYEVLYQKINVMGTFIDASLGYSKINDGPSIGNENERGLYFKLNRPLFHPFVRWAGGLALSNNISTNVFKKPDTTFANYHYDIQDYWLGYSFGQKELPSNLKENRNRKFIALRGYQQYFSALPTTMLTEPERYLYRTRIAFLGQLTFFKQDFYKTQYVLGFGRTEDVPYGYRISFTAGWEKELGYKRPYMGSELYYNNVLSSGTILTYTAKAGYYLNNAQIEDGLVSLDFQRYSRIFLLGQSKVRHQLEVGYARLYNQTLKRGFDIRDINGITGFSPDSLVGTQRLRVSEEVVVFTPWKLLGFKIAPVARIDLAFINRFKGLLKRENFFSGISVGVRARNENLIFNTVEARLYYFPKTVENIGHFAFFIGTNIRIKYPSNLVNPPSTVFN